MEKPIRMSAPMGTLVHNAKAETPLRSAKNAVASKLPRPVKSSLRKALAVTEGKQDTMEPAAPVAAKHKEVSAHENEKSMAPAADAPSEQTELSEKSPPAVSTRHAFAPKLPSPLSQRSTPPAQEGRPRAPSAGRALNQSLRVQLGRWQLAQNVDAHVSAPLGRRPDRTDEVGLAKYKQKVRDGWVLSEHFERNLPHPPVDDE